jgi:DNA polymerase I
MMEISCTANPHRTDHPGVITVTGEDRKYILDGPDRKIIDDMFDIVQYHDPDIILFPDYDSWSGRICAWAQEWGMQNSLSRSGKFRNLASRSYFSYGRMEHRLGAKIPEGRLIFDTRQSFMYRQGDIRGILLASRLTGLSPNLTSRLTPGTLVSSYEVYEALSRGIAVPFRKIDAEANRCLNDMRLDYRGGLTLQPEPGIFKGVTQLDFTSFYPSIIVKYNLSPETIEHPERKGFLPSVLEPLLTLRLQTKLKKPTEPHYAGMDGILKWMLVTCFGYTGYKNARFGRIEVHEEITLKATDILYDCVTLIQGMQGKVLHGIVDCLFIQQCNPEKVSREIEKFTGFHTEYDEYDWIVFLPQADGTGSYGNYYGRLISGKMKYRGVAARRRTSPPYVQQMQNEMFDLMATAKTIKELIRLQNDIRNIHSHYRNEISHADISELVITRRIGRDAYQNQCMAQAILMTYQTHGVYLKPGMDASYIVRDEKRIIADPAFDPQGADIGYYRKLIDKAFEEVDFACGKAALSFPE